jgi:hypothetical protein
MYNPGIVPGTRSQALTFRYFDQTLRLLSTGLLNVPSVWRAELSFTHICDVTGLLMKMRDLTTYMEKTNDLEYHPSLLEYRCTGCRSRRWRIRLIDKCPISA